MTTASSQTPDPRMALLQEIGAKVPDPVHEIHAYGWAKLELLGHRVLYGYLDQVEFCGSRVLRMASRGSVPSTRAEYRLPPSSWARPSPLVALACGSRSTSSTRSTWCC